jgi:hypothetical protein
MTLTLSNRTNTLAGDNRPLAVCLGLANKLPLMQRFITPQRCW